jgi:hypothetical protein
VNKGDTDKGNGVVTTGVDHCHKKTDCASCNSKNKCGWCKDGARNVCSATCDVKATAADCDALNQVRPASLPVERCRCHNTILNNSAASFRYRPPRG